MKFKYYLMENFTAEMHKYIDKKMLSRIAKFLVNKGISVDKMNWQLTPYGRGTFVRNHTIRMDSYTDEHDLYSIGVFKVSKSVENYNNKIILILTSPDEDPVLRMVTYDSDNDYFYFNRISADSKEIFTTKIGFTSGLSREEYTKLKNLRTERDAYKKPTPFEKQIASYHKKVDAYMRNKGITEY